jgi:hypothetical protein
VLYEAVRENLATLLAEASELGRGLPAPVRGAGRAPGTWNAECWQQAGAVSFIQFFGSALQVTPHFHSLVPDGVFVPGEGGVRFEALPPPTQGEVEQLLRVVRHRVLRLLEKRGALPAQGPEDARQAYQGRTPCSNGCAGRRWTCDSLPESSPGAPSWKASPCMPIRTSMPTTGRGWSGYAAMGRVARWR